MLSFFFFNDTATTEIYTLSLHDALPILGVGLMKKYNWSVGQRITLIGTFYPANPELDIVGTFTTSNPRQEEQMLDRKSTRLNSSHGYISYAVFCLKKKNTHMTSNIRNLT